MQFGAAMFFTDASMAPGELGPLLEQRGFESLWVPEHSHIPLVRTKAFPGGAELPRPYYDIMDPFLVLTAAAVATKDAEGRHRRLPDQPARSDPDREAGRLARPAVRRPLPVRRRQRLEQGGDGTPRHRTSRRATSCRASASRRCRRSGRRTPPSTTASSSTSRRCRPGRSRCSSRFRRSLSAAPSPMARAARCAMATAGSPAPAGTRHGDIAANTAAVPRDGARRRARSGLAAGHAVPRAPRTSSGCASTANSAYRAGGDQPAGGEAGRDPADPRPLGAADACRQRLKGSAAGSVQRPDRPFCATGGQV